MISKGVESDVDPHFLDEQEHYLITQRGVLLDSFYVATFQSVSQALRFEKALQKENLDVKMIPVPRVISSSCGIAARITPDAIGAVSKLLQSGVAEIEDLYRFAGEGKKMQAEHISEHRKLL